MKLGPLNINLAKKPAPPSDLEVGTGAVGYSLFDGEVINTGKVKVPDLIKMRQQDGTASALNNILTLPIRANSFNFEADEGDTGETQMNFVKDALTLPPHKGGMTTPFSLVLADMLRAVTEGYRLFEKVWTLNPDGKVVYKKLAARDNQTVVLKQDPRGGFNGAKQRGVIGSDWVDVDIPVEKCFLFTFGKEHNFLYGESAFLAAYYHYDKKHRLYYLAHQAGQQFAIPPKVGIAAPNAKQKAIDEVTDALSSLGVNSATTLPNGWSVETMMASGKFDLQPLIDHHNAEMARSILAQFMMLGSGGSTGSWALSNDQSDMFILALKGLMANIEEHINTYLIPDLIDYNFETAYYPRFKFSDMTDATVSLLKEAFTTLANKIPQGTPDYVIEGVMDKVAKQLKIEKPTGKDGDKITIATATGVAIAPSTGDPVGDAAVAASGAEIQKTALNGAQIQSLLTIVTQVATGQIPFETASATISTSFPTLLPAEISAILNPVKNFKPAPALSDRRNRERRFLADTRWSRQLTPAEGKVQFAAIVKKLDTLEEDAAKATKPIWDDITAGINADLKKILDAADYAALTDFKLDSYKPAYVKALMDQMVAAYNYAKNGAADEMDVNSPATPPATRDLIKAKATATVDKQFNDLIFKIQTIVSEAQRKNQLSRARIAGRTNLSIADVLAGVTTTVGAFYDNNVVAGAGVAIATAINIGRDDVFEIYKSKISKYQYSAIMDETTCPICEDLDGSVVDYEEYLRTEWMPPIHFNCRCIWVEIMTDETDQPDFTGLPEAPGDATSSPLNGVTD